MRSTFLLSLVALASCSSESTTPGGAAGGGGSGTLYFALSVDLEIHKLNLATGEDLKLGKGDAPHSTPDSRLIFATPSDLAETDETMAAHRVIVARDLTGTKPWTTGFGAPQLSPDGTKLVYVTYVHDMYVVNRADGVVLKKHERKGATDGWYRPTWTPDGRIVAGGGFGNQGLYISDASLGTMTRFDPGLADPKDPAVSPDGKKVVFVLNDRLHVMNIDGTGMKRIDASNDADAQPSWSPDGTKLVYRVGGHIKFMSADGGTATDLFDMFPALKDKYLVISGSNPLQWK